MEGKFIDLDFAYISDLSIIDYRNRTVLFKIIIDIEHYLKIRILKTIEDVPEEYRYNIVNQYMIKDMNDEKMPNKVSANDTIRMYNYVHKNIFKI